ncbi:Zn-dependent protease [Novosphingobium chloroacetimidivorans]|uniref:Zn-dependent protease n=1 Tax=Novosphingobium chloroacetimidivorans TaxID=1428314 RepID=A0A7W7NWK1_9SPHN|nr:site-2 protease family protein [Novosphingobium chloroacetimidivorans]MBB4858187.1 Zn-dependent protease [Novosphingobium chloroacetimidivorans]
MQQTLLQAAALIVPLIVAIVFHEVAHGWVAWMLGDPTAHERRRLSLNPLRHVDPIGTIVVPGMLALASLPTFGWAKPVPVDHRRLRNPRFGMMAVAAAGPLTNLVLAALGAVTLGLLVRSQAQGGMAQFVVLSLTSFVFINVSLALFNLLPIPPFDGSHILEGLLPRRAARAYEKLRPIGFPLVFVLLVVVPYFWPSAGLMRNVVLPPVLWMLDQFDALVRAVAGA